MLSFLIELSYEVCVFLITRDEETRDKRIPNACVIDRKVQKKSVAKTTHFFFHAVCEMKIAIKLYNYDLLQVNELGEKKKITLMSE